MKKLPILILQGWNLSKEKYEPLINILKSKGFSVFMADLPGFGENSNLKKPITLKDYADFIYIFINKNKLTDPIVIGHSFGGRVVILLSSMYPNLFSKIVFTGVPGYPPVSSIKVRVFKFIAKIGNFIFTLPIFNLFSNQFRKFLYFSAGSYDYYKTSGVLRETFKNIVAFDLKPLIKDINIPTLIIWGKEDKITPVWIARKMHHVIKNSQLEITENEGHSFLFKNPSLFINKINDFIN